MLARSWIGSGGSIYSAGGRPVPTPGAPAPLSPLGEMLRARLRQPAARRDPEPDPSVDLACERERQVAESPAGRLLAARAREAAADDAEAELLEHAIPQARAELAEAIAQRDRALGERLHRAEIRRQSEPRS